MPTPTLVPFSEGDPVYSVEALFSAAYGAPVRPPNVPTTSASWINFDSRTRPIKFDYVEECAETIDEAREFVPTSPISPEGLGGPILSETETARYFEFELPSFVASALVRVHRCSYFRPRLNLMSAEWNLGRPGDVQIGTLGAEVTEDSAREFADFDWSHYTAYLSTHGAWLETRASTQEQTITADVYAALIRPGDTRVCDRVYLARWRYVFDQQTRGVRLGYQQLADVEGHCH